jgi:hypothetical protein
MAINKNNSLKAKHTCVVAGTGGGKTAAVNLLDLVGPCTAIFDVYGDYQFDGRKSGKFNGLGGRKVFSYDTRASFSKAFIAAWQSGKRFVISYQPSIPSNLSESDQWQYRRDELDWFARMMWEASDGNRLLTVLIEELAKLVKSIGKDTSIVGELATGGRKFGLQLVTIFQRSQEVPKTIWNNSPRKVIGALEAMADAKQISGEIDVPLDTLIKVSQLNSQYEDKYLHYIIKPKGGMGLLEAKRAQLRSPFKVDHWTIAQLQKAS